MRPARPRQIFWVFPSCALQQVTPDRGAGRRADRRALGVCSQCSGAPRLLECGQGKCRGGIPLMRAEFARILQFLPWLAPLLLPHKLIGWEAPAQQSPPHNTTPTPPRSTVTTTQHHTDPTRLNSHHHTTPH